LSSSGPTPISGAGGATSGAGFGAGSYDLSETGPDGYNAGSWTCVGGTQDGASVSLTVGQTATCTIVNDDEGPGLTLIKYVTNDNGGTAVDTDFVLSAAGPTPISGAGGATSTDGFEAGTYSLSETGVDGYTAGDWVCDGGTQDGASISLDLVESPIISNTNDVEAPSLTLDKVVVNDNGGTAVDTDFVLSAAGPTPISGAGGASSGAGFEAGSYDLSETGLAGYTAGDWVCDGGTQDGASISLDLGESANCSITKEEDAPSLTLDKYVVNNNRSKEHKTEIQ
jgi:hypothetical protein